MGAIWSLYDNFDDVLPCQNCKQAKPCKEHDEDVLVCDNCGGSCEAASGDRDRAVFCCNCVAQSAREHGPATYRVDLCGLCSEGRAA